MGEQGMCSPDPAATTSVSDRGSVAGGMAVVAHIWAGTGVMQRVQIPAEDAGRRTWG